MVPDVRCLNGMAKTLGGGTFDWQKMMVVVTVQYMIG
jgi:hypothetical protein